MKKIVATIFALIALNSNAQEPTYSWSPTYKFNTKTDYFSQVLEYDENGLFVLRREPDNNYTSIGHGQSIEKYDNSLKLIYSTVVKLDRPKEGSRDKYDYLGVLANKGIGYGFCCHWEFEKKIFNVVLRTINETGELSEPTILGKDNPEKFMLAPEYKFVFSPDGSKFAAIGIYPFEKDVNEKWHVLVYQTDGLKKLLDKTVEIPVPNERFELNDIMLTNSGVVQSFKKWDVKKEGKFQAIISVFTDGTVKKTNIDLGGKNVVSHKYFINKKGNATVVGFVDPEDKNWGRIAGHFYASINDKGEIVNLTHEVFGEMVLQLEYFGLTASYAQKENKPIDDYKFIDVLETDNGEVYLFLDKYSKLSKTAPESKPEKVVELYEKTHKNAIIIKLDNTGKKVWAQKFEKKQNYETRFVDKFWGGYIPVLKGNNFNFIWNNMDFPTITGKIGTPVPGWADKTGQKHYLFEEYGGNMVHPTCISGFDADGNPLFNDQPVNNAMPLTKLYKSGAIYGYTFSSDFFARFNNTIILLMEMPAGFEKGGIKFQLVKIEI